MCVQAQNTSSYRRRFTAHVWKASSKQTQGSCISSCILGLLAQSSVHAVDFFSFHCKNSWENILHFTVNMEGIWTQLLCFCGCFNFQFPPVSTVSVSHVHCIEWHQQPNCIYEYIEQIQNYLTFSVWAHRQISDLTFLLWIYVIWTHFSL